MSLKSVLFNHMIATNWFSCLVPDWDRCNYTLRRKSWAYTGRNNYETTMNLTRIINGNIMKSKICLGYQRFPLDGVKAL